MKILVVCFVLALAAGKSFRTHPWETLVQIDNTPYGKRLLDTIQLQVQAKASVDRILSLLRELKDDLLVQQSQDDNLHQDQEAECSAEISGYEAEIARLHEEIAAGKSYLDELRPQYETAVRQLAKKNEEIQSLSAKLSAYDEAHSQDVADYIARVQDHQAALRAVGEALVYVKSLEGSEAGEGKHETSVAIDAENKAYGSLIQLAADQETVAKLVNYLEEIQYNLQASIDNEHQAHEQAEKDYADLRAKIVQTLADLENARDDLILTRDYLNGEIVVTEEELARDEASLKSNEELKAAKEQLCEQWRQTYFNNKAKRSDEVSTVDQVVAVIENQLTGMSDYLSNRVQD